MFGREVDASEPMKRMESNSRTIALGFAIAIVLCSVIYGDEVGTDDLSVKRTENTERKSNRSALPIATTESISKRLTAAVIDTALRQAADGFSTDEVLIRDDLRERFMRCVQTQLNMDVPGSAETIVFQSMLKARKAGKLTYRSTKRARKIPEDISTVAEMAARVVCDRHRISSDALLVDSDYRRELTREAQLIQPGVDPYNVRRSLLSLRKRRSLKPELVLQVAQWDRTVETHSLQSLKQALQSETIATAPGIYLFRAKKEYLYIGEAKNLRNRLNQHVADSDRESLAEYLASSSDGDVTVELHVFSKDSPAAKVGVRRAYESELIRSRHPRLNVRP